MENGQLSESPLSLPLQIHIVDWLEGSSPGQALLLLVTMLIYKHGDYKPSCPFHSVQYLADLLHKYRQLPL